MAEVCDDCGDEIDGKGWEREGWIGWWGGTGAPVKGLYVAHKGCCRDIDEEWSAELAWLKEKGREARLKHMLRQFTWPDEMKRRLEGIVKSA